MLMYKISQVFENKPRYHLNYMYQFYLIKISINVCKIYKCISRGADVQKKEKVIHKRERKCRRVQRDGRLLIPLPS